MFVPHNLMFTQSFNQLEKTQIFFFGSKTGAEINFRHRRAWNGQKSCQRVKIRHPEGFEVFFLLSNGVPAIF